MIINEDDEDDKEEDDDGEDDQLFQLKCMRRLSRIQKRPLGTAAAYTLICDKSNFY